MNELDGELDDSGDMEEAVDDDDDDDTACLGAIAAAVDDDDEEEEEEEDEVGDDDELLLLARWFDSVESRESVVAADSCGTFGCAELVLACAVVAGNDDERKYGLPNGARNGCWLNENRDEWCC